VVWPAPVSGAGAERRIALCAAPAWLRPGSRQEAHGALRAADLQPIIAEIRAGDAATSLRAIAAELNSRGIPAPRPRWRSRVPGGPVDRTGWFSRLVAGRVAVRLAVVRNGPEYHALAVGLGELVGQPGRCRMADATGETKEPRWVAFDRRKGHTCYHPLF
jgi:hypothetical protein